MNDVFLTVVLVSVYEGLADVGSSCEHPQSTPLTVINTWHRLLGFQVYQCHVSAGVRHPALDLHFLMIGQDVVAERLQ